MGQTISTVSWYRYGKQHFTRTGWEAASKGYSASAMDTDLTGKVYIITGANSGIGFEITKFLAKHNARVYMICRNPERANAARSQIVEESKNNDIHTLIGDCSLRKDVHSFMKAFEEKEPNGLHGLVCNAGALLDKKTLTSEGWETTFACHLLNGSYLLSQLAIPSLKKVQDPRVVFVTSGGMYLNKLPNWDALTSQNKYDGTNAYSFAKRGQVLLADRLKDLHPEIKFMSAHPGWCDTPGVESAFGSKKSWLEPMRSLWEGAEGIAWLLVAPFTELKNGSLYLDRQVQPKWLPGKFMPSCNSTKDVDAMMSNLEEAAFPAESKSKGAASA